MARNRTISPDFWTWEAVIDCKPMTRLLFIGLQNFADDGGVQPLRPRTIRLQVFPGDDISNEAVRAMIDELAAQKLVRVYSVEGVEYVAIVDWDQLQRVGKRAKRRFPSINEMAQGLTRAALAADTIANHSNPPPTSPAEDIANHSNPPGLNTLGPHAEEAAQRPSRSMGERHRADCPPFETRPAGAPQGEVEAAAVLP